MIYAALDIVSDVLNDETERFAELKKAFQDRNIGSCLTETDKLFGYEYLDPQVTKFMFGCVYILLSGNLFHFVNDPK